MATTKKTAAKKPTSRKKPAAPELEFKDGYWWIISGTKRVNAGRNKRYAENLMAQQ